MKRIKLLIVIMFMSVANLQAVEYVMLNDLDTTKLPEIKTTSYGGEILRAVLGGDLMWEGLRLYLASYDYSCVGIFKALKLLEITASSQMVGIPCAYKSTTPQGDSIIVSGAIYLPYNRELKGIVIGNHHTMTADFEAPSNMTQLECMYTIKGYAVIVPDHVGLGITRDKKYPFMHWRHAAQTSVDMLNCLPELLDYYGYSYPKDVVVSGYSLGGTLAFGVTRYLEELNGEWSVRKLYSGSAAYDPTIMVDHCIEQDSIAIPAILPLTVMGLGDAYELDFTIEDFFQEPLKSNYDNWMTAKIYTFEEITDSIGTSYLSEIFQPMFFDKTNPKVIQFYEALEDNNLVGYDLKTPAYFLHSVDDQTVPFATSKALREKMPNNENIEYDFDAHFHHVEGAVRFLKHVYQEL